MKQFAATIPPPIQQQMQSQKSGAAVMYLVESYMFSSGVSTVASDLHLHTVRSCHHVRVSSNNCRHGSDTTSVRYAQRSKAYAESCDPDYGHNVLACFRKPGKRATGDSMLHIIKHKRRSHKGRATGQKQAADPGNPGDDHGCSVLPLYPRRSRFSDTL